MEFIQPASSVPPSQAFWQTTTTFETLPKVFHSSFYQPNLSPARLLHQYWMPPFFMALLLLMVMGLFGAMNGRDPLWPLIWGTGLAYAGTGIWAWGYIRRQLAEMSIDREYVVARSMWDVAMELTPSSQLVTGFRWEGEGMISVNIGQEVKTLHSKHWEESSTLFSSLRQAANLGGQPISL